MRALTLNLLSSYYHVLDYIIADYSDRLILFPSKQSKRMSLSGFLPDFSRIPIPWVRIIDATLVLILSYVLLLIIGEGERRNLWMIRGFIVLMLATVLSQQLNLTILNFVLEKLVLGAAVAMAVIFQPQFRRLLEQLGRGQIRQIFKSSTRTSRSQPDSSTERIVEAVKELSQNRTGALMLLETDTPLEEQDFVSPGVSLNAEISKELLQTIFQTSTLLHDGAVVIRGSKIISAATILPLSERTASRQLGTRHRAAMGVTERIDKCICIVVSEETGSISLAQKGILNRPLTSNKLKELLQEQFSPVIERDPNSIRRRISFQGKAMVKRLLGSKSKSHKKNR